MGKKQGVGVGFELGMRDGDAAASAEEPAPVGFQGFDLELPGEEKVLSCAVLPSALPLGLELRSGGSQSRS